MKTNKGKTSNIRNRIILLCVIGIVLFLLYWIFVNFLVSACLVPSFMKKLDAFEEITEESLSQQIRSDSISLNKKTATDKKKDWLGKVSGKKLSVRTSDGYRLVAAYFAQPAVSHKWVLLLHGYTGWKEEMYEFACDYYEYGYNCIVPDMRASGESEGDYIGMGWTDHFDSALWLDEIRKMDPEARIVLHGQSMGATTALIMSGDADTRQNVVAVVSDSAYTDAYSMFQDKIREWFHLPAFPLVDSAVLALKLRGGYDLRKASARNAVKSSTVPTLFIHGDADRLISVDMAYELYDVEAARKELMIVEGVGHGQTQYKYPKEYYDKIFGFLEKCSR